MDHETDVLVVGGGATGAGVARDLSLRGPDVTLVERGPLAGGTTGRSHGLLHSGARYAVSDPESASACFKENRILADVAAACVDDCGGYVIQLPEDPDDHFERTLAACEDCGIPAEAVSGEAARDAVPALSKDAERAIRVPDGVVDPVRLTVANAVDARQHGARIEPETAVTDLLVEGGRVTGAELRRDGETATVRADHVVNATGAWAGRLGAMAGVDIDMRPTKGVMVALDFPALDAVVNRCRPPNDGDIVVPFGNRAVVGTTSVEVPNPDVYPEEKWEVDLMRTEGEKLLPDLHLAPHVRSYWGVRPLYEPAGGGEDARGVSRDFVLLDHAERDGVGGLSTIVGGKLTTYRRMAEATADRVCDVLGVNAACETAERPLPGGDDPAELDEYVAEFGADPPAGGMR